MGRTSGLPDSNAKPSLVLFDSGTGGTFAWEGEAELGAAFVQIVDNSGTPIVSFGGGTQYTDGGTPPTHPIGPTLLWNNGGTWQTVSAATPLPVSGSLSLSNYALETGGNLATLVTNTNKIPSLGQALAAASVPVVLTAIQLSALTPPTNSGYALDASLVNVATIGAKTDAKSTSTDGTSVSIMQVLKQISAMAQAPASTPVTGTFWQSTQPVSLASVPSHAVTNAGIFAVQATEADGANTTLGSKADAKSSATDTTAITIMQVLKQISASVQAPPSQAVTNAGTFAVQAAGDVASGSSDSGNPVKIGGIARSSEATAVTSTQRVNAVFDLVGKQIVLPYANPENFVSGVAGATDTTSTSLLAAPAAGLRNYITQITIWNSSAANTYVKLQDGSGGTEIYDIPAPATGGAVINFPTPLRQPTTATALFFAANASANAIRISASGYKGA